MLDANHLHQGIGLGLQQMQPSASLRIAAMVSSPAAGAHAAEQAVLWPLCAHWQRMGLPVLVLDGTATESSYSPGLAQLLNQTPWAARAELSAATTGPSVGTLPSALGLPLLLQQAHQAGLPPLAWLYRYVCGYAAVLVYAPVQALAPVLRSHDITPLMVLPPQHFGLVSNYQQIKHLAVHAGVSCLLAPLKVHAGDGTRSALAPFDSRSQRHEAMLAAVLECAERHLGRAPQSLPTELDKAADMQRLASHLLANAGTIDWHSANALHAAPASAAAFSAWSH